MKIHQQQRLGAECRVQTVIRSLYRSHYRRMLPRLLQTLEFRSNNMPHHPLIQALELLTQYAQRKVRTYPVDAEAPLDGVVSDAWIDAVMEQDQQGQPRVNRLTYEICVPRGLREQLCCKEIWAVGADRCRNPDEDVLADFDRKREVYYAALQLPLAAEAFIETVQHELRDELAALDWEVRVTPMSRSSPKRGAGSSSRRWTPNQNQ